jgi:hypothetical protein
MIRYWEVREIILTHLALPSSYRLGKYSYARETDRSSSRALSPMNARLGMLEAIIMTVIPKQSQLKMVRFKILTEDHLYE